MVVPRSLARCPGGMELALGTCTLLLDLLEAELIEGLDALAVLQVAFDLIVLM